MSFTPSQKITTFLTYFDEAEQAAEFYTSLFPDSRILSKTKMVVKFTLLGHEFLALNGQSKEHFQFTPAVSLYVNCEDQAEIDRLYEAFTKDGGAPVMCGWVKDKFGVSWQLVPKDLPALIGDSDPEKSGRAMRAMRKMVKLDIAELKKAHAGTE